MAHASSSARRSRRSAPYQPGRPIEDVQRELGLERVVKLASNEGPFPPFPAALAAMDGVEPGLNRYPDGGTYRLHEALAARHGVGFEEVCAGSGADGCLDMLSQAILGPGDEVVCGWPSFPSYVIYAAKQGATVDAGAAPRAPLRPRRPRRGGRAEDEDRLRLPPEQPDRDDEHPRRARRVPRPASRRRPDGDRPGVLRVHRPRRLPRCRRRVLPRGAARRRPAHVLEDLRPRRAPGSATPSARRTSARRWRRCAGRSTSRPPRRPRHSRASTTPTRSPGGAP